MHILRTLSPPTQAAPVVTTRTQWISVVEGSDVTLECTAIGAPLSMFKWVFDLITTPAPPQNDEGSAVLTGQYPIRAATSKDQKRYWCIAQSISVNPPLGKRRMIDMTYVDLIVTGGLRMVAKGLLLTHYVFILLTS